MDKIVKIYAKTLTKKNYSPRTVSTYSSYLEKFLNQSNKNPYHVTTKEIAQYLSDSQHSSISGYNQSIGALKLFARYILGKKDVHLDKIERPRKNKKLPQVIDREFILDRIQKIPNLKHRAILSVAFSVGLRVSEAVNLKIGDIDSKRMLISVRQAKGNKDRIVPLSPGILDLLREYFKAYRPKVYLFNGQSGSRYSAASCNKLVKKYLGDGYHFHTLRHSSFTSMLESGTDLRTIQKIAGHSNIKTTELYTHVSASMLAKAHLPL